jgi:phage shock protein C
MNERGRDMKKLYLSNTDKKILGICGGIGESYGIDSTLVRLLVVALCILTAVLPFVLIYLIAWFIIPKKI